MEQRVICANEINQWLSGKKALLVCGRSFDQLDIKKYIDQNRVVRFSGFAPNPTYDSVVEGIQLFKETAYNAIIAVGGGSAMDVAKCIKLFSNMDDSINYLKQEIKANAIPFLAIPTTAGTGSEATKYAVIYYMGEKQSITHISSIPETVVFESSVLHHLPLYQKKATMMDALCHAIESYWSVNSTDESKAYSRAAVKLILEHMDNYLQGESQAEKQILEAANTAGKAINITQTTAGHAMCYKLTSLYGISHGHAAALCASKLWPYMIHHTEACIDPRGQQYLCKVFDEMSGMMGTDSAEEAAGKFQGIINKLELAIPEAREKDFDILKVSVNPVRLKNNPVKLEIDDIEAMYRQILKG